jgi:putative ABC transport system permease protein
VPASFRFEQNADLWLLGDRGVPRFTSIPNLAESRDVRIVTVVGRLRDGVSLAEAQAELDVVSARIARDYPATNKGWGTALDPLQSALVGHTRPMLVLLFGAVALMLLIASVNVANLMLVRTKARALELAMRSALGASPGRVLRQVLAESSVLAVAGGLLGMLFRGVGCQRTREPGASGIAARGRDRGKRPRGGFCPDGNRHRRPGVLASGPRGARRARPSSLRFRAACEAR